MQYEKENMSQEITIPCLPCISLEETFPFYEMLGFQVTYRQKAPNVYGVVQRGGVALHFFGMKGLVPNDGFSTCLVLVSEVEQLHTTFANTMRQTMDRLPVTGIPRITRMKPGQTRFTITDPAGNSIIFIKRGEADQTAVEEYKQPGQTSLQKAIVTANRLRDYKGDDAAAAKVLDLVLARNPNAAPLDKAQALAARVELAVAMGDGELAKVLRAELGKVLLSADEREHLRNELSAADSLESLVK